ncbi:DUF6166 domain-containing protein (plasmid) [Fibrella sp. ES10-3-2-2]
MTKPLFQLTKTTFHIRGTYHAGDAERGEDEQCRLFVDGQEVSLAESLTVRNHSPSGLNWGYGGSGPAQAALAICLHIFQNRYVAEMLYQDFKWAFVAKWQPQKEGFERTIDIADFLIDHRADLARAADHEAEEDELMGWSLLEEAERLLNPVAAETTVRTCVPVQTHQKKPLFIVGDVVQTQATFLDSPAGCRAVVYECYEGGGVSIITEAGDDLGGFSVDEQQQYLTFLYHADFTYEFRSVSYLHRDWRAGVFLDVFR